MSSVKNNQEGGDLLSVDLNLMSLSDLAKGEDEIVPEAVAQTEGNEKESVQKPKPKPSAPRKKTSQAPAPTSDKKGWGRFIELAEHYKSEGNEGKRGEPIWIDTDIKNELERIKRAGNLKIGVRHLMNGMLRAFMEQNADELKKLYSSEKSIV